MDREQDAGGRLGRLANEQHGRGGGSGGGRRSGGVRTGSSGGGSGWNGSGGAAANNKQLGADDKRPERTGNSEKGGHDETRLLQNLGIT